MRTRPSLRVASLFAHKNPFDLPPAASWTRLKRFEGRVYMRAWAHSSTCIITYVSRSTVPHFLFPSSDRCTIAHCICPLSPSSQLLFSLYQELTTTTTTPSQNDKWTPTVKMKLNTQLFRTLHKVLINCRFIHSSNCREEFISRGGSNSENCILKRVEERFLIWHSFRASLCGRQMKTGIF